MILRGILDRSLSSQICIRGFAPIKELAKISRADYSYQRNPIDEQEGEISKFLDEEEFLFFPEVILSYKIKSDYTRLKDKSLTPIQLLEQKGSFKSNIDNSTLKTKNVNYKDKSDIRGSEQVKVVELYLDDAILQEALENEEQPFNRVDGNHIIEIEGLSPISLINIYSKIRESKSKQVFVSMQFDQETKLHYKAIVKVIEEINVEFELDIQLREIRIDNFNVGHSYKIDDEILSLIEESGLLIADLSSKNINVYQELGYLMGLNQGKGLKQENFILIKRQEKGSKETDIGFNIRPFQQLRFKSEMELMKPLKSSIIEYYELEK